MKLHPGPPAVVLDDLGDVTVVTFAGNTIRLNEALTAVVAEQLSRLVEESRRHQLLLNFDNVVFLSSVGLGMLIRLQKQLEGVGGCFVLCNVAPEVYEVFENTRLTGLLNICLAEPAAGSSAGNGVQGPVAERHDLGAGLRLLRAAGSGRGEPHETPLDKRHRPPATPQAPPPGLGDLSSAKLEAKLNAAPWLGDQSLTQERPAHETV
jgi:stage II sporulation protein AA (anti-sigma F factor antagonist)